MAVGIVYMSESGERVAASCQYQQRLVRGYEPHRWLKVLPDRPGKNLLVAEHILLSLFSLLSMACIKRAIRILCVEH